MQRQDVDEVVFHDASVYFSEEEWKLLQEWQKQLCRNVMKEIQQAVVSLGPLIATTVCSLRGKVKDEMCSMESEKSERRQQIAQSPGDATVQSDVLLRTNEENLHHNFSPNSEGREIEDCPNRPAEEGFPFQNTEIGLRNEKPMPNFINHLGEEIEDCSTRPNSGYEIVSVGIKDEDEGYCMEQQDGESSENINCHTGYEIVSVGIKDEDKGYCMEQQEQQDVESSENINCHTEDGAITRPLEVGESTKFTRKKTAGKASSCRGKGKMVQRKRGRPRGRQVESEHKQDFERAESTQYESDFLDSGYVNLQQGTTEGQTPETYSYWGSNVSYESLQTYQSNVQMSPVLYPCSECNKTFDKKASLKMHMRTHVALKPYQCTECEKCFSKKQILLGHKRTHTGERPFPCKICNKSFNQTGILNRHIETHLKQKPHQCSQCGKRFKQSRTLASHRKTHMFPKKKRTRKK